MSPQSFAMAVLGVPDRWRALVLKGVALFLRVNPVDPVGGSD